MLEDQIVECIQMLRKRIENERDPEQLHKMTCMTLELAQDAVIRNRDLQDETGYDPRYEYDPEISR